MNFTGRTIRTKTHKGYPLHIRIAVDDSPDHFVHISTLCLLPTDKATGTGVPVVRYYKDKAIVLQEIVFRTYSFMHVVDAFFEILKEIGVMDEKLPILEQIIFKNE